MSESMDTLLDMMRRLRDPGGCPWSRRQSHESLVPYAVEEAHEIADAVDAGDDEALADELGDLLFQVIFHAQLGAERGAFDFDRIAGKLAAKLVKRTPHVFGEGDHAGIALAEVERLWEEQKQRDNPGRASALDGIPSRLPELARAQKLLRRAQRAGLAADDAARADGGGRADDGGDRAAEDEGNDIGARLWELVREAEAAGLDAEGELRRFSRAKEARFRAAEQRR